MKKRGISLLVALVLLLSTTVTAFAATFEDVGESFSWAMEAIDDLAEKGIISGYPDGTFKPEADITKEEAIALFAKALGFNEEVNTEIVDLSIEMYKDVLENYSSYALDQAAYLMYRDVITEDDLVNYLTKANKEKALKRYEAAILISKALGADSWIASKPDFDLAYIDSDEIPVRAKAYVYYAGEKGIMKGMDDNAFVPDGNVTRAQVAVMIHRILNAMNFTYERGMVAKVDTTKNNVTIKTAEGETLSYNVTKDIPVKINGELSQINLLDAGLEVIFTKSGLSLYAIDAIKIIPDENIVGIYKGKLTETKTTSVKIADMETGVVTSYKLAANAAITYKGEAGSLSSYQNADFVKAEVRNGEIVVIDAEPKTIVKENLILETIEFTPDVTLKVRSKDNEVASYVVDSKATLKRNNKTVDFSELAIGDDVDITLEYGVVTSVVAIGTEKTVSGIIDEITISKSTSYITVNTGSQSIKYALSRDIKINLDGRNATVYDLRLGAQVELETSSSTITELTVKSAIVNAQVTGTITLVNSTYGMIVVSTTDASGDVTEEQIFVKSTAKILDANDGKVKAVRDLKEGQKIMAAVTENTGILEAASIMILAQ